MPPTSIRERKLKRSLHSPLYTYHYGGHFTDKLSSPAWIRRSMASTSTKRRRGRCKGRGGILYQPRIPAHPKVLHQAPSGITYRTLSFFFACLRTNHCVSRNPHGTLFPLRSASFNNLPSVWFLPHRTRRRPRQCTDCYRRPCDNPATKEAKGPSLAQSYIYLGVSHLASSCTTSTILSHRREHCQYPRQH